MRRLYTWVFILALLSASCRPSLEIPNPSAGILAVDNFVAIGDGYTAGISNANLSDSSFLSGWYQESQANSFPKLLSHQFAYAKTLTFRQPMLSTHGNGHLFLESMSQPLCEFTSSTPVILTEKADQGWTESIPSGLLGNLGFQGLSISDVTVPQHGLSSPIWPMLGGQDDESYLQLISKRKPGLFTLFVGLEDLLSFGLSGGNMEKLPSVGEFVANFQQLLSVSMEDEESIGLIANLPDPGNFPFFKQIEPKFVNIENCRGSLNPIFITTGLGDVQEARDADRIHLSVAPFLGTDYLGSGPFGLSGNNPVPSDWVIDAWEHEMLRQQLLAYNQAIDSIVYTLNAKAGYQRLAVVNLFQSFDALNDGILEDGIDLNNSFLSGGIFSLDGIYLTPRGNAWLANQFINTINHLTSFGARIPPLDLTAYPGIRYP